MICLVHGILVLALLLIINVVLVVRILDHLMHLDLVSDAWRALRALHVVDVCLMDVVFASAGSSGSWVRIDAANPVLS